MNLLNIESGKWDEKILGIAGENLASKLGNPVNSWSTLGDISTYMRERYWQREVSVIMCEKLT